ncbi:MAG TPA: YheU family protein [Polyangiales bacterium]
MPKYVEVPHSALSRTALEGLVEEFITREGTDYGQHEYSLDHKREGVLRQLTRGAVVIVFDLEAEATTLVTREELAQLGAVGDHTLDD